MMINTMMTEWWMWNIKDRNKYKHMHTHMRTNKLNANKKKIESNIKTNYTIWV